MAAQPVSVNLLNQPEFESSSVTRLFNWAVTYGRYIMIGTEVIVLLAFISRFSLDRKLTDLREEIAQKQIILEANKGFEEEIKRLQLTTEKIKSLLIKQEKPVSLFSDIILSLPQEVILISYKQQQTSIEMKFLSRTADGFSALLQRLQSNTLLSTIEVSDIKKNPSTGIEFSMKAKMK